LIVPATGQFGYFAPPPFDLLPSHICAQISHNSVLILEGSLIFTLDLYCCIQQLQYYFTAKFVLCIYF
jgi:hypothetical protein